MHPAQGPKLGLPQMTQSRAQFGVKGADVSWIVGLVGLVGLVGPAALYWLLVRRGPEHPGEDAPHSRFSARELVAHHALGPVVA